MTRKLAAAFRQVTYVAGTVLLRTGERHGSVWVVQQGSVGVVWEGPDSSPDSSRPGSRASERHALLRTLTSRPMHVYPRHSSLSSRQTSH
jgi:hypothetical protein